MPATCRSADCAGTQALWHLWAMGVGAVISGDFFGWNFGLRDGGFGGMLLAVGVMTAMYLGLCLSIAEMSAALPHAGGAYSFARTAMGPWGGYITGLAENMEYILTPGGDRGGHRRIPGRASSESRARGSRSGGRSATRLSSR